MSWELAPATQFARQHAQWDAINAASSALPMLEASFVQPLIDCFASGRELVASYARDGRVVAMALLAPRGRLAWETFQPSQAPVGLWLQLPGQDTGALLAELIRALPGMPLVCSVLQRDPLRDARPANTPLLATMDYIATARVPVAGSFEDYWQSRGKNLRANLKKQRARLARDGVTVRMDVLYTEDQMAAAVADYGRLEQSGWKAARGTAVDPADPQGAFYQSMLSAFGRQGRAAIYRYWFDGQLVAMDLCIASGAMLVILKTAYDGSVPHALSPTLLMREDQFRSVFEHGRTSSIEFYGKVMEWHLRWTEQVRTMYHITAYRWPILPALIRLARTLKPTTP